MTNGDDKVHLLPRSTPYTLGGETHEKAGGCGCGRRRCLVAGLSAQQAAKSGDAQTLPPAPKLATAHPSTRLGDRSRDARDRFLDSDPASRRRRCVSDFRRRAKQAGRAELRELPQREDEGGRARAGRLRRGDDRRASRRRREDDPQAARRHDAAARRAASRRGDHQGVRRRARSARWTRAAALNPNPGWRPFQRLNRAEYQRAVKDLLGIDVDVNAFLPPDTISNGFDNVADVQTFSPTLMEGYLRAASQISRLAVGDRNASDTSATYKIGRDRLADAPRRRRADGHARRHLGRAHLPGRRRLHVQGLAAQRAARRHLRPHHDGDDGHQGADRGVGQRRARRAARPQRRG